MSSLDRIGEAVGLADELAARPSSRRAGPCTAGTRGCQAAWVHRRSCAFGRGEEEFVEVRGEDRVDAQEPQCASSANARAFYRILLGHHDRLGAGQLEIGGAGSGDGRETGAAAKSTPERCEVARRSARDCRCRRRRARCRPRAISRELARRALLAVAQVREALARRAASRTGAAPADPCRRRRRSPPPRRRVRRREPARAAAPPAAAARCRSRAAPSTTAISTSRASA